MVKRVRSEVSLYCLSKRGQFKIKGVLSYKGVQVFNLYFAGEPGSDPDIGQKTDEAL